MEEIELPTLPPADVSPYDSPDENGPIEYAWYERSVQAYAREAVLMERQRAAGILDELAQDAVSRGASREATAFEGIAAAIRSPQAERVR